MNYKLKIQSMSEYETQMVFQPVYVSLCTHKIYFTSSQQYVMLVFMSWEQFVVTSSRKSYQIGFQTLQTQTMHYYFDLFLMKHIFWHRENVLVNETQRRNKAAGFHLTFISWYQSRRKKKKKKQPSPTCSGKSSRYFSRRHFFM